MGDFADMALSEAMDAEDDRLAYRMGAMSDHDAFELGIIDHRGFYSHSPMFRSIAIPRTKTCRHCGAGGLRWGSTSGGWRLHDAAGVHVCAEYKR